MPKPMPTQTPLQQLPMPLPLRLELRAKPEVPRGWEVAVPLLVVLPQEKLLRLVMLLLFPETPRPPRPPQMPLRQPLEMLLLLRLGLRPLPQMPQPHLLPLPLMQPLLLTPQLRQLLVRGVLMPLPLAMLLLVPLMLRLPLLLRQMPPQQLAPRPMLLLVPQLRQMPPQQPLLLETLLPQPLPLPTQLLPRLLMLVMPRVHPLPLLLPQMPLLPQPLLVPRLLMLRLPPLVLMQRRPLQLLMPPLLQMPPPQLLLPLMLRLKLVILPLQLSLPLLRVIMLMPPQPPLPLQMPLPELMLLPLLLPQQLMPPQQLLVLLARPEVPRGWEVDLLPEMPWEVVRWAVALLAQTPMLLQLLAMPLLEILMLLPLPLLTPPRVPPMLMPMPAARLAWELRQPVMLQVRAMPQEAVMLPAEELVRSSIFMRAGQRFAGRILRKKHLRTDALWTKRLFFKTTLQRFAIWADVWALMQSQYWPVEELQKLQEERIRALLRHTITIPFWRDRFTYAGIRVDEIGNLGEFKKIPILRKQDILARDAFGYLTGQPKTIRDKIATLDHTSGSTGIPLYFYLDRQYELRSYGICERMFRVAAGGKKLPVIAMRARWRAGFVPRARSWFFVRSHNSIQYRAAAFTDHVKKFLQGFILYAFPSYAVELARIAERQELNIRPKVVIVSGEQLPEFSRAYLEERFGCRVISVYSARELGWMTFECAFKQQHVASEWVYIEIVDTYGNPCRDGEEGRILATLFDNYLMPFIRYDTGDRGIQYVEHHCPCGRTLPLLQVTGRQSEMITLGDRLVSTFDLMTAFDSMPVAIRQFQFVQGSSSQFTILVVPGPQFDRHQEALLEKVKRIMAAPAAVSWKIVEGIPPEANGKRPLFKGLHAHAS